MQWYLDVLKKYAVFTGRARRKEYWMFALFNCIVGFVLGFICGLIGEIAGIKELTVISNLFYPLAIVIPALAVLVRRMHDTDHSGWWCLCPVVNLVFCCMEGTKGENRFGPDPKAPAAFKSDYANPFHQPNLGQSPSRFNNVQNERIEVLCPGCTGRLRIPTGRHGSVRCPRCTLIFAARS